MEIKLLRPTDVDYPIIMKLVPFADKYDLMKIDDLTVVPLLQVFDAISVVKADIDVKNGVECCPTCGKPIKDIFTKDEVIAMFKDLIDKIDNLYTEAKKNYRDGYTSYCEGVDDSRELIQQKINSLKENKDGDIT